MSSLATSIVGGVIAILIVGGAVSESVVRGTIDPAMLTMATAVVATFFTGQAIRSSNGLKMDAVANAIASVHSRLDAAGIPPSSSAADGRTAAPGTAVP